MRPLEPLIHIRAYFFPIVHPRYKDIVRFLTFYTNSSPKKGFARGPVLAWYFLLALPMLAYPLVLLVAQLVPMKGVIVTAGMLALTIIIYQQSHRIYHVSRSVGHDIHSAFLQDMENLENLRFSHLIFQSWEKSWNLKKG